MELREYQIRAVDELRSCARSRPLLVSPVGSGKTVMACEILRGALRKGRKALFVAHRRELVFQAQAKLEAYGVPAGLIMAGEPLTEHPIQVASLQTLVRRQLPEADLVVFDEAHHCLADTYLAVMVEHPNAVVLGLTATPFRTDGKALGEIFGAMVIAATPMELIEMGYLVEPRVFAPPVLPDLKGVATARGDYVGSQVAERMDKAELVGNIVEHWQKVKDERPTVVFAASVEHSKHLCFRFGQAGAVAHHIDHQSTKVDRDAILKGIAMGLVDVVCNYGILTEGWDLPQLGCGVVARPTKSLGLHHQMIGRIVRPDSTGRPPVLLDHAGNTFRHGFITDEIELSLKGKAKRGCELATKTCPECYAILPAGTLECPCCGADMRPVPRCGDDGLPVELGGELTEAEKTRDRKSWYRDRLEEAHRRGHQVGWARHRHRAKYGAWPGFFSLEKEVGF